jgi:hypothetical protein
VFRTEGAPAGEGRLQGRLPAGCRHAAQHIRFQLCTSE